MTLKPPQSRRLADPDSEVIRRSHEEAIRELQKLVRQLRVDLDGIDTSGGGGGGGSGVSSVTAGSSAMSAAPTTGAVIVDVVEANLSGIPQSAISGLTASLAGKVDATRAINTTAPLSGGGDLSANRTLAVAANSIASSGVVAVAPNDLAKFWRGDATWATSAVSDHHLLGLGSDGAITFDGVTTPVAGATLSGSQYTLLRDIDPASMTVSGGVSVFCNNFRVFCSGTITCNGTIHNNGNNASGVTGGAVIAAQCFPATFGGGAGRTVAGAGATGSASSAAHRSWAANSTPLNGTGTSNGGNATAKGRGGGGGGATNGGGDGGTITLNTVTLGFTVHDVFYLYARPGIGAGTAYSAGAGGGSGGLNGAGTSGGGGGGGGFLFVSASTIAGTGTISCNGGNGGNGTSAGGQGAGGGGGGGGWLTIVYGRRTGSLSLVALGGNGGSSSGAGAGNGGNGGPGTVRLINFSGDGS